jgi:hypothetical protein
LPRGKSANCKKNLSQRRKDAKKNQLDKKHLCALAALREKQLQKTSRQAAKTPRKISLTKTTFAP